MEDLTEDHLIRTRTAATAAPPRRTSPFDDVRLGMAVAAAYAAATLVWVAFGQQLPGGRWLAVHLFTLGVLTNAVVAFSHHFGLTLTRSPGAGRYLLARAVALNAAVVLTLVGQVTGARSALAIGATAVSGVVLANYLVLRRARRDAIGARFGWIVRVYERAHGAFLHGALLGALLGTGVLGGRWYGSARLAHLHVNVLGWGALTLLATVVFFGPTMLRRQLEPGADARAARVLRWGATGVSVGALLLLASGVGGAWGDVARWLSALAFAGLAAAATLVVLPVARVARTSAETGSRALVLGVCAWLAVALWADVAVVATASWQYLDAVGLALLVGVLGQAIVATLLHLAPVVAGTDAARTSRRANAGRVGVPLAVVIDASVVAGIVAVLAR